jgi:hypothetical protein
MFNNFFKENRTIYEIMWKNTVQPGRPQLTIRPMRIADWIQTHTEYVTFIAFPLQQWFHEHVCVTLYLHCLPRYLILLT